jgi:trehalose transport system substrate-binding protein
MKEDSMRSRNALDDLVQAHLAGKLSRRQLVTRAGALGVSVPVLGAILGGVRPSAVAAQEDLQLGTYDGRTLRISLSLAESERVVFEDVVAQGFTDQTQGEIELVSIESEDVIRTLEAQVQSGNIEIDLLTQDNNSLAPLVDRGLVEELPEAAEVIPAETIEALREVLQFDGKYYFLPARPNVQITYYNERALTEAEVQPPKTWEELLAAGKTIEEKSGVGKVSIQGEPLGAVGVTVTQFLWQAGGDPLTINNEAGATAFQFMRDLQPYLTPQYPTATFDTTNTYILNESVVLAQNWPFGINVIVKDGGKEEVKTYSGWAGPEGQFHVLGGDVFGIVKGTENKDMALDFAKYFMSKEIQETLTAQLGWPAIREDAFGAVEEWQQPYFESVKEALTHVKPRPNVTYWGDVEQILTNAFNDIVTNGADVQETLDRYQGEIDAAAEGAA